MMAGWTFFLAILVSLQVAQDGVHSCTLRSHKVPGSQSTCSIPGAADPTPAIPRRTPASCATPTLGLQKPDALNKIPRPGSDLLSPAVPSDRLLPSLTPAPPAHVTTTTPPAIATVPENAMLEAAAVAAATAAVTEATATAAPVDVPKSTPVPETAPAAAPNPFPATDPADGAPANVVQASDPGSVNVPALAPTNSSNDSTFVAPETSDPAFGAISPPVSNTVPAADSVSASTSDVASSASPPSDITTPSIV